MSVLIKDKTQNIHDSLEKLRVFHACFFFFLFLFVDLG